MSKKVIHRGLRDTISQRVRPSDVPSDPVRRNVRPVPVRNLGTSVPGLLSVVRELSAREVRGPFDIVLLD